MADTLGHALGIGSDSWRRRVKSVHPAGAPLALWRVVVSGEPGLADWRCLSEDERRRACRFRFVRDRNRYVVAHMILRRLLAAESAMSPENLQFGIDRFGKPRLLHLSAVHFSLSYAGNFALIGISRSHEIGVDAEAMRPIGDADELADLHFSCDERRALARHPAGGARDSAFLHGWTRKEACVKAIGVGLGLPTAAFDSGLDSAPCALRIACDGAPIDLEVGSIGLGADLVAAWARRL